MKAAVGLALLSLALVGVAPASAAYGPPEMVSNSSLEQADVVGSVVLSADGRYLAFSGSLDGFAGIFRKDLRTGAVEPVAAASAYGSAPILDAFDPSISSDGRFVSFTTAAALDPIDDPNGVDDVYVRDMDESVPAEGEPCTPGGPCAYRLASALDRSATAISGASMAGARTAISADGNEVAFKVTTTSDLAGPGTPAGQIAVRNLATEETTLVSTERDSLTGAMTTDPVQGGAITAAYPALSADGTTVVWDGAEIARQAATVPGDPALGPGPYNEPLWRRIADGPGAPTRRVAGAADPEAPGCPAGGSFAETACQGPYPQLGLNGDGSFGTQAGWLALPKAESAQPQLSADGLTVAFLGDPPSEQFGFVEVPDAFVADMRPGVSRKQAVRRLTLWQLRSAGDKFEGRFGDYEIGISADGDRVAFAAARNEFPLTPPFLSGGASSQVGLPELWVANLEAGILERVSKTTDGGPSKATASSTGGAASPSFDASGGLLAFVSNAENLVVTDGNETDDAFLVADRSIPSGSPGRTEISAPPSGPTFGRAWQLRLHAASLPDGLVRLVADCPARGALRAVAWTTAIGPRRRQVDLRSVRIPRAGVSRLELRAARPYRRLIRTGLGLEATVEVTFRAYGHKKLTEALPVRFRVHEKIAKPGKAGR